jgi:hypothetical protein
MFIVTVLAARPSTLKLNSTPPRLPGLEGEWNSATIMAGASGSVLKSRQSIRNACKLYLSGVGADLVRIAPNVG